jgi:hypothetical protein
VSLRCGTGLFVTDDLLQQGHTLISVVSLRNSLAGVAMKQGRPLLIPLFPFTPSATATVACVPVSVPAPDGTGYRPLYVGALMVGTAGGGVSAPLAAGLASLSRRLGPALLTVGLASVQHLAHLLSLRDQDAALFGEEEELQDLPADVPRPARTPATADDPFTQPLHLPPGSVSGGESESEAESEADRAPAHPAATGPRAPPVFRRPSAASPARAGSGSKSTQHPGGFAGGRTDEPAPAVPARGPPDHAADHWAGGGLKLGAAPAPAADPLCPARRRATIAALLAGLYLVAALALGSVSTCWESPTCCARGAAAALAASLVLASAPAVLAVGAAATAAALRDATCAGGVPLWPDGAPGAALLLATAALATLLWRRRRRGALLFAAARLAPAAQPQAIPAAAASACAAAH